MAGEALADRTPVSAAPDVSSRAQSAFEFMQGKLLADGGDFRGALDAFRRSLDTGGEDPYALVEMAKLEAYLAQMARPGDEQLQQLQKAAELAEHAKKLEPQNTDILRSYAQIHLRISEIDDKSASIALAQGAFEILRSQDPGDVNVLVSLGQLYMSTGEPLRAAEVLAEANRFAPGNRMLLGMLAEAQLASEKWPEAEATLRDLVKFDPTNLEHRIRLAELLSQNENHREAVSLLSEVPPADRTFRLKQAMVRELHLAGDNEAAFPMLEELSRQWNGSEGMLRLKVSVLIGLIRYQEALELLDQLPKRDGASGLQDLAVKSRLHERLNQCDLAAETLEKGRQSLMGPSRKAMDLALAGVLHRCGNWQKAQVVLEEASQGATGETWVEFARARADILNDAGQIELAQQSLESAAAKVSDEEALPLRLQALVLSAQAERWQDLLDRIQKFVEGKEKLAPVIAQLKAQALAGLGRIEDALSVLGKPDLSAGKSVSPADLPSAVKRWEIMFAAGREAEVRTELNQIASNGDSAALLLVAQVLQRLEQHAAAAEILEKEATKEPFALPPVFTFAVAAERAGRREESVAAFERILVAEPDNAAALNYLGYMFAERGENLERALALIRRAVALEPDNGAYVDSLGWVYYRLDKLPEARQHLEWAQRLVDDDETIFEHLGTVYARLGLKELARGAFAKALKQDGTRKEEIEAQLKRLEAP